MGSPRPDCIGARDDVITTSLRGVPPCRDDEAIPVGQEMAGNVFGRLPWLWDRRAPIASGLAMTLLLCLSIGARDDDEPRAARRYPSLPRPWGRGPTLSRLRWNRRSRWGWMLSDETHPPKVRLL